MSLMRFAEQAPPAALDAEQAVLGSMLLRRQAIDVACEMLQADDFYRTAHAQMFALIRDMSADGEGVDVLTVAEALGRCGLLEGVGGKPYLLACQEAVSTPLHVDHYAGIVADRALRRRLIQVSEELCAQAYAGEETAEGMADRAEQRLLELSRRRSRTGPVHMRDTLMAEMLRFQEALAAAEAGHAPPTAGIASGIADLDALTCGFQPGNLILLAGRPGMGKSGLGLCFAGAAAEARIPVALFSLEMSRAEVAQRVLAGATRIASNVLRQPPAGAKTEWGTPAGDAVTRGYGQVGSLPLYVDEATDVSALEIRARCRRMLAEVGLGLVLVDYIQLLRGIRNRENKHQEIAETSRMLKTLARELHVPVIALSQLSRNVERREDRRPTMSDMRESGSLEADADLVLLLYREAYYKRHEEAKAREPGSEDSEETELILAKQRNGPTGMVKLTFLRRYARFEGASLREPGQ